MDGIFMHLERILCFIYGIEVIDLHLGMDIWFMCNRRENDDDETRVMEKKSQDRIFYVLGKSNTAPCDDIEKYTIGDIRTREGSLRYIADI